MRRPLAAAASANGPGKKIIKGFNFEKPKSPKYIGHWSWSGLNIASEASYVYILSDKSSLKMPKWSN